MQCLAKCPLSRHLKHAPAFIIAVRFAPVSSPRNFSHLAIVCAVPHTIHPVDRGAGFAADFGAAAAGAVGALGAAVVAATLAPPLAFFCCACAFPAPVILFN